MDSGGEQQQQSGPSQQTVTQTSIPEYARPYVEQMLGRAQALTTSDPYHPYQGQRVAGFSPLQNQAFAGIAGLQPSAQLQPATDLATRAGQGFMSTVPVAGQYGQRGYDIGSNAADMGAYYERQATTPAEMQRYMSPYMQGVVDVQQREAQRQAGIAGTQRNAAATAAGAFGGSRHALVDAEADRNLQRQLGDIQATGLQNAYQQAQQAQQFRANLGLQGYQTGLQGIGLGLQGLAAQQAGYQGAGQQAANLGQLGQTEFGQRTGILNALSNAGAQQQGQEQKVLDTQYGDFQNETRYPYQQLSYMSDILRGVPLSGTATNSLYQAPPSATNQLLGYGLGAYGLSNLFGKAKGGEIKAMAAGGIAANIRMVPESSLRMAMAGKSDLYTRDEAALELQRRARLKTAVQGQQAQEELGIAGLPADNMNGFANGGIVAFDDGGEVPTSMWGDAWRNYLRWKQGVDDQDAARTQQRLDAEERLRQNKVYPWQAVTPSERAAKDAAYAQAMRDYKGEAPSASQADVRKAEPGVTALAAAPAAAQGPHTEGPIGPNGKKAAPAAKARATGIAALSTPKDNDFPGIDQLLAGQKDTDAAQPAQTPTAQPAGIESLADTQKKLSGSTNAYVDKMVAALAKLDAEPDQAQRKGVMALKAAQELLKGGRSAAESRGAALGTVGDLVAAYQKEDDAAKRSRIGAEINLYGTAAQLDQGNTKIASDLFQNAQRLAFEGIRLDTEKVLKQEELRLKKMGLTEEEAYHKALLVAKKYEVDAQSRWHHEANARLGANENLINSRYEIAAINAARASLDSMMKNGTMQQKKMAAEVLGDTSGQRLRQYALGIQGKGDAKPAQPTDFFTEDNLPAGARVVE